MYRARPPSRAAAAALAAPRRALLVVASLIAGAAFLADGAVFCARFAAFFRDARLVAGAALDARVAVSKRDARVGTELGGALLVSGAFVEAGLTRIVVRLRAAANGRALGLTALLIAGALIDTDLAADAGHRSRARLAPAQQRAAHQSQNRTDPSRSIFPPSHRRLSFQDTGAVQLAMAMRGQTAANIAIGPPRTVRRRMLAGPRLRQWQFSWAVEANRARRLSLSGR